MLHFAAFAGFRFVRLVFVHTLFLFANAPWCLFEPILILTHDFPPGSNTLMLVSGDARDMSHGDRIKNLDELWTVTKRTKTADKNHNLVPYIFPRKLFNCRFSHVTVSGEIF